MKGRLRRLEKRAEERSIVVPQQDGPPARFSQGAAADAFVVAISHATGKGVSDHPLCRAARNSSDPWWRGSVYAAEPDPRVIPDFSEPR